MGKGKEMQDWAKYADKTKAMAATEPLKKAMALLESDGGFALNEPLRAVDLGSGAGRDTLFLLQNGWNVTAIDKSYDMVRSLQDATKGKYINQLSIEHTSIEDCKLSSCHLINAHHSLPFCSRENIDNVMQKMIAGLVTGGYCCGTFFGNHDEWSRKGNIITLTEAELRNYFSVGCSIEFFKDSKPFEGKTISGDKKIWHIFSFVVKKVFATE